MNVPLDTADRAADVLIGFRQAGVAITSVSVDKPTLDEVFFAITGHGAEDEHEVRPDDNEPDPAADNEPFWRSSEHHALQVQRAP